MQNSSSIDIWSAGCILAEMCNMKPLFMGGTEENQLEVIFQMLGTPTEDSWPGWEELPNCRDYQFLDYRRP
jgi:serine/threonine protein kinase